MKDGQRIMIENCAGLGDLVMFTPALRKIKELYPHCHISFITKRGNGDILRRLPYIDNVYFIERGIAFGRIRPARHLLQQDYTIYTRWQPQMAFLSYLLRVPHRIGLFQEKYKDTNLFHKSIKTWVLDTDNFVANVIAENMAYALDCSLPIDPVCDVSKSNTAEQEKVRQLLRAMGWTDSKEFVVIAPYTSRKEKDLPQPLVSGVQEYILHKLGMECVIVGPGNYHREAQPGEYDLCGQTSLYEMIALLEQAAFVVASDSGPMHIACALKKKTVGVFSKDIPKRWAPMQYCYPVSVYMDCSPCGDECAEACKTKACINNITVAMIAGQIGKIMQGEWPDPIERSHTPIF